MQEIVFGLALVLCTVVGHAQIASPAPADKHAGATSGTAVPRKFVLPLEGEPTLKKIEASQLLRVGVAVNPPWVVHNGKGELTGYSVDIAHKIAASMGWKLELVPTSWGHLLPDLRTDKFDVIITGMSITPLRARAVAFTLPVGEFDIDAVVNRSKFGTATLADLRKQPHLKVAAHKGELTADLARTALPNADVSEVENEYAAIADVSSGKLDAYIAEAPLPHVLEKIYPDQLRALDTEPLARTAHGFAVRVNDTGLLRVLNAFIVFEQASGWLKERSTYWFEDTGWAAEL
jgi:polar amino acid transport system substrate-binding protein